MTGQGHGPSCSCTDMGEVTRSIKLCNGRKAHSVAITFLKRKGCGGVRSLQGQRHRSQILDTEREKLLKTCWTRMLSCKGDSADRGESSCCRHHHARSHPWCPGWASTWLWAARLRPPPRRSQLASPPSPLMRISHAHLWTS